MAEMGRDLTDILADAREHIVEAEYQVEDPELRTFINWSDVELEIRLAEAEIHAALKLLKEKEVGNLD